MRVLFLISFLFSSFCSHYPYSKHEPNGVRLHTCTSSVWMMGQFWWGNLIWKVPLCECDKRVRQVSVPGQFQHGWRLCPRCGSLLKSHDASYLAFALSFCFFFFLLSLSSVRIKVHLLIHHGAPLKPFWDKNGISKSQVACCPKGNLKLDY